MLDLLIKNIGELATAQGNTPKKGTAQGEVQISHQVSIGITDGKISYVGPEEEAPTAKQTYDAEGCLVTPGLVDAHTHLVFGGWRQHELPQKLAGATYLEILKGGGGILSTVRNTRAATEEELVEKTKNLLDQMIAHGTTTVEAKSGYGLSTVEELKQLRVVRALQETHPVDLVSTFMGAHAIPEEYKNDRASYVKLVCEEMIPTVAKEKLAEFCDIFCEAAVFDIEETRKILNCAKEYGFGVKLHGDEIDPIGGGELAGELEALSAEHLIEASDAGIEAMAKSGTIGVLLPATSMYLDKSFARARKMLDTNMAVAIATDFNPGSSPNFNMQIPMTLACLKYRLSPKEALTAVTLNGACAIRRGDLVGTIEVGKQADIVVWDAPDLNFLFYRYGNNQVKKVIKKGNLI